MAGRKTKKTTFHEGKEAEKRFDSLVDAVLSVPKKRVLELEQDHQKKQSAAKKKRD